MREGATMYTVRRDYVNDVVAAPDCRRHFEVAGQVGNKHTSIIEGLSDGPASKQCDFCGRTHGWRYGCDAALALAYAALGHKQIDITERGARRNARA